MAGGLLFAFHAAENTRPPPTALNSTPRSGAAALALISSELYRQSREGRGRRLDVRGGRACYCVKRPARGRGAGALR